MINLTSRRVGFLSLLTSPYDAGKRCTKPDKMSKPNSIERKILTELHGSEKVDELISDRYSTGGKQTNQLVVTGTVGSVKDNKERQQKQRRRKLAREKRGNTLKVARARDSLREFITEAREGREHVTYADFQPMHVLWKSYISELLSTSENTGVITGKLASADFHGALLEVVKSKNPTNVGIKGLVTWEARTSFVLVTPDDRLVIINKAGTVFRIQGIEKKRRDFDIIGSRFMYRTADRSARKFKSHSVDGLVC